MKHFVFFFAVLLLGAGSSRATAPENKIPSATVYGYSNSFIFAENGITFAVYPDGEFDFYIDNQVQARAGVRLGGAAITFNSGYNYNPFVQYDDYGAVVQVQHVPVYYDYYGRVNQIGNVRISYRNNRVYRLGGMRVFYTPMGYYDYHIGYINPYNRVYVYRPYHRFFIRPAIGHCLVYPHPYRRYYHPVRYTYYRPYHNNTRRAYARVGKTYRYRPRTQRSRIYRNDHRVVARESVRSNRNSLSRTSRSPRTSVRPSKTARYSETGRSRTSYGSKSVGQAKRSNARTNRAARKGSAQVVKRNARVRPESGRNDHKAVRQSSRAGADRGAKRITGNSRSRSRSANVRGSNRNNSGRSKAVTQRAKRKPERTAKRPRRQ
ncbi:MAG: hypothetical protein P8Z38_07555 [Robiginitalea sp.]